jgi:hypothetical protein
MGPDKNRRMVPPQRHSEGGYPMTKTTTKAKNSRRDFLKLATASAPAAVAAVALVGTEAEAKEASSKCSGLQDTAHTRAYFDSARF